MEVGVKSGSGSIGFDLAGLCFVRSSEEFVFYNSRGRRELGLLTAGTRSKPCNDADDE